MKKFESVFRVKIKRNFQNTRISLKDSKKDGTKKHSIDDLQKALSVIENTLTKGPSSDLATEVPAIPITRRPFFPGFYKTVSLKDSEMIAAVREALTKNRPFVGAFLTKQEDFQGNVIKNPDDVHHVGVLAQIYSLVPGPNQTMTLLLYPHRRVRMKKLVLPPLNTAKPLSDDDDDSEDQDDDMTPDFPPLKSKQVHKISTVSIDPIKDILPEKNDPLLKELVTRVNELLNQIVAFNPLVRDQMAEFTRSLGSSIYEEPGKLADFVASMCDANANDLQQVLEMPVVIDRLKKVLGMLKQELIDSKLQNEISKGLDQSIGDKDREYFLNEKLKAMQKELGIETVSRDKMIDKFRSKVSKLVMPETIKLVFNEEINRLRNLRPASQEYHLSVSYLDWLTQVPWGKSSKENFDIDNAQKILDQEHFGMKDVKDRIMEFIAVGKLCGSVQGKILCLSGPPGVGKTSIGRSIAKALNREFYRFSVGGLYDVAEIKDVGAMPGKLVQALKKVQTQNPLILIDEIGKGGHSGDPSSALLEVLDPEQNTSFMDHYLDVPIDLSKVLFVCTANLLDTIPGPLLDRMEVINLSGYVSEEKLAIAKNYLIPQTSETVGLTENQLVLTDDAINALNQLYCRESGVRNLKKHIEKIYRKAAYQVVSGTNNNSPIVVSEKTLKDFVGGPVYSSNRLFPVTPCGVVAGLAYNSIGGSVLYIESVVDSNKSKGHHHLITGNLGSVMKESTKIAYSYARHFVETMNPHEKFFQEASIHTHVPEGAIPKDGPSAGIALCSSLVSLALNKPLRQDTAMTGELTLTGKVLKIGGVKEKVMGARRSGIKRLILPIANKSDFEELADYLKTGLEVHYVDTFKDVYAKTFE